MSKEKDVIIAELTKQNAELTEQVDMLKEMLSVADVTLAEEETFLLDMRNEIVSLKSSLNHAEEKLGKIYHITDHTWYGKTITAIYRFFKKVKRFLFRK